MTQTSIHLTVVTGERLFGDLFKTMLGEVGAKKDIYIYVYIYIYIYICVYIYIYISRSKQASKEAIKKADQTVEQCVITTAGLLYC